MYIWNITIYEPSPLEDAVVRPMRSRMLSDALCQIGHEVEMWMPGFEHVHHLHFRKDSCFEKLSDNYGIQYIKGCGYDHDVSLKRFQHNRQIAHEFLRLAKNRERIPDLLFTQVPSLELAEAVVAFAQINDVPVVVDVRDPWPDIYKRLFPQWCSFLYPVVFISERWRAQRIFGEATAITAVSRSYLDWALRYAGRKKTALDEVFYIGYPSEKSIVPNTEQITLLKDKFGVSADSIKVTFTGTFGHNFDLSTVVEAAEILSLRGIEDVQFIIAGKGKGEEVLLSKSKQLQNIIFLGWIDSVMLKIVLSISSIGLAPFPRGALNSLPNKPFEYMSTSLPILTSLDGELRTMLEEKKIGVYYPAGNAEALVDAIIEFRNNLDLMVDMGRRARQIFEKEFMSELIYPLLAEHLAIIVKQKGVDFEIRR